VFAIADGERACVCAPDHHRAGCVVGTLDTDVPKGKE
jgi:hypothetical protein